MSRRLLAPLVMMGAIFWFSAQTFEGDELAWWEVVGRNLGHFAGYALLAVAWAWALNGRARRPLAAATALSLVYALSDEYHQTFVEGRTGTWEDVVIDGLGIAAALLLIRVRASRRGSADPRPIET